MKNKIKNIAKLGILLFGISLMIISCQKDDDQDILSNQHQLSNINYLDIDQLPDIKDALNKINSSSSSNRMMNTNFGGLNLSNILQYIDQNGKETYSFLIQKEIDSINPYTFENLHLVKLSEGYWPFILKWIPNEQGIDYEFNIETFTGTLKHYDLDYNLIQENELINGLNNVNTNKAHSKTHKRDVDLSCNWIKTSLCTDFGSDYCGGTLCGYGNEYVCIEGSGGGSGGSSGSGGSTGPTGGGGSGGNNNNNNNQINNNPIVVPRPPGPYKIIIANCINIFSNQDITTWYSSLDANDRNIKALATYLDGNCSPQTQQFALEAIQGQLSSATPQEQVNSDFIFATITNKIKAGKKPLAEHLDKCVGLNSMWDRGTAGPILYPEIAGVLTSNGAILETAIMGEYGGETTGLIEVSGNTYYYYPTSEGPTTYPYPDTVTKFNHYYIPINAYIHTHSIAIETIDDDGVTGERDNSDDLRVKTLIPNINHYIIGDNTLGEMTLSGSDPVVILSNSTVSQMCSSIN